MTKEESMQIIKQSKNYTPELVKERWVDYCRVEGVYYFREFGEDRRYWIRRGIVDASELPESIRVAAVQASGVWPSGVKWPTETENVGSAREAVKSNPKG